MKKESIWDDLLAGTLPRGGDVSPTVSLRDVTHRLGNFPFLKKGHILASYFHIRSKQHHPCTMTIETTSLYAGV